MNDTSPDDQAPSRRGDLKLLAFGWLALSVFWAGVILVTDAPAWPLALWIATTLGPLTLWRSRIDSSGDGS